MISQRAPADHGTPMIRPASAQDLPAIVRVHVRAFTGFFMTRLGRPFLKTYYGMVLAHPRGILLVAEGATGVEGFAAGFTDPSRFYASLRGHAVRLAVVAAAGITMRPALWPRLVRTALGVLRSRGSFAAGTDSCELASLAVCPSVKSRGTGRALVAAFMSEATANGAARVYLTTAASGNARVNDFYRRLGFTAADSYTSCGGETKTRYEARLPWAPPPADAPKA